MPIFQLHTNVSKDKVTPDLLQELSKALAKTLGKPENYCAVHIISDQSMLFGGTSDPCGHAIVTRIGNLEGADNNKEHSKVLIEIVEKRLGISKDRIYITFNNVKTSDIGYIGSAAVCDIDG